jgi:hypothetical protein
MKLIDAERLEAEGWKMERMRNIDPYCVLFEKKKPTEFDGVESVDIVRCRECIHHKDSGFCAWWSWYGTVNTDPNGYCNFGERGESDDRSQNKRRVHRKCKIFIRCKK